MVGATYVDVARVVLGEAGAVAVYGLSIMCSVPWGRK